MRPRRRPIRRFQALLLILALAAPLAGLAALSTNEPPPRLQTRAARDLVARETDDLLELRSAIESSVDEAAAIELQRRVEARKLATEAKMLDAQAVRARFQGNDDTARLIELRLEGVEDLMKKIDPGMKLHTARGEEAGDAR